MYVTNIKNSILIYRRTINELFKHNQFLKIIPTSNSPPRNEYANVATEEIAPTIANQMNEKDDLTTIEDTPALDENPLNKKPKIVEDSDHPINYNRIPKHAWAVLKRLKKFGIN